MEKNIRQLNEEELGQVAGASVPISADNAIDSVRKRKDFEARKKEMENVADIRMRAAELALKAAVRIDKQEQDIKEAMRNAMNE